MVHYANPNTERCFVCLYKLYCSKCPRDRPENVFYLTPRCKPTEECWYSKEPVGHNVLGSTVKRLCQKAGVLGYKTNHSLRVPAATRLFQHGVDEQIIMLVTGHHSTDGVQAYKIVGKEQYKNVSHILQAPVAKGWRARNLKRKMCLRLLHILLRKLNHLLRYHVPQVNQDLHPPTCQVICQLWTLLVVLLWLYLSVF